MQNVPNYKLSHLNGHFKVLRSFVNVSELSELTETCFVAFNTAKHVLANYESSKALTTPFPRQILFFLGPGVIYAKKSGLGRPGQNDVFGQNAVCSGDPSSSLSGPA